MLIRDPHIDDGKPFDWGNTSEDYARYRDIYPSEFYQRIKALGLAEREAKVLDIGTGTGVLPRGLYDSGASFTGTDVSDKQIIQAKLLAEKNCMDIDFLHCAAEDRAFPDNSFDTATACQCWWYFNHEKTAETMYRQLRPNGKLAFLVMNWLPFEDKIAEKSEQVILKHNPSWTGCGFVRGLIPVPDVYFHYFDLIHSEMFDLPVSFTRNSWHGRIRACRGVGASLSKEQLHLFEQEHIAMLESFPEIFSVLHNAAIVVLRSKKER